MAPLLPWTETLVLLIVTFLMSVVWIRWLHPVWWKSRLVKMVAAGALVTAGAGLVAWKFGSPWLAHQGVVVVWTLMVVWVPAAVALMPAVGFRAIPRAAFWVWDRLKKADRDTVEISALHQKAGPTRRAILQAAAVSLPLATIGASAGGLAGAQEMPRLVRVPMTFPGLHPDLNGFRILHLSDLHLGYTTQVGDVEQLVRRLRGQDLDMLVVTGDIADDLRELGPCLEVLASLRPRYGIYASLGNHEYIAGIDEVRDIFERGPVPLLVRTGRAVQVGRARLLVAAADDQEAFHGATGMLEESITEAASHATDEDFRLLLCHRPDGFPIAARSGFDLTLSGHTHGGQVGAKRRSIVDMVVAEKYAWGSYAIGQRRLYTTSGLGQWFPFRLQCPREAALIVLEPSAVGRAQS